MQPCRISIAGLDRSSRPFLFPRLRRAGAFALILAAVSAWSARASLATYDAVIASDNAAGLSPAARLTNAVTLTGANRAAFNFGANSGNVTFEFVLEGNPSAGIGSAYLAVGASVASNLRYEQFNNTGQLGFTQLGVLDYLFSPVVPSPVSPTHIAYAWDAASRTMKLYVNGSLGGVRSGVDAAFAMPAGQGWLGGNPGGGETMVGTIHRLVVYDDLLADAALQRHSDAFNDVARPPILVSFSATPDTLFSPASSTLTWSVQNAVALFLNGTDVTALPNLVVAPAVTTSYSLVATNAGGSVTGRVSVLVNPAPVIRRFTAAKGYAASGESVPVSWQVDYGQSFQITPGPGDVTPLTLNGAGTVDVQPLVSTTYTLSAGNAFGTRTAIVDLLVVHPANHPVISEFMADNQSVLADEDGQFPDWIEILNPTTSGINLAGYFLTDDKSDPTKWGFPSMTLAPGGHLVVFASGNNRTNPASPLHTNFQLDKGGEYLALVGPGPTVLHAFDPFPPQDNNVSYGVLGGDVGVIRAMGVPTPGAPNNDTPAPPAPVRFSRGDGTFVSPFLVELVCATPGAEIRYTEDGSRPGPTNGLAYTGPIPVTGTTRFRAAGLAFGRAGGITGASFIKLAPELAGYTSSLPILVIDNFGAGIIPQKGWSGTGAGIKQQPRQAAVWATFERQAGASALTNVPQMISAIGIRGRGAYSSTWRQKPYGVEALDAGDRQQEVSPLGLPPDAEWTLYFPDPDNDKDPTLFFNTFPYELSRQTGHYSVRVRWVEAFINEDGGDLRLADRRGVYAIIEKVSRGPRRLDFQPLSEDGATGGWLLGLNRMDAEPEAGWPAPNGATQPWFFHTPGPNRVAESPPNGQVAGDDEPQQSNGYLNFDTPNGYTINTNQRTAIEGWFKQFEAVLWNNAIWRDPVNGYRKYLDPADFADYFILNTLTRNGDGLLISMFPWKGDDGKLRMGPAWDFNWSAYYVSGGPTGTLLHRPERLWYLRLFADPDFLQLYIDRWWDHRRGAMSNAGMDAIIDSQTAEISTNKAVLNGFASPNDWLARVTQMKTWLKDRANWIDGNYVRPPVFNQDGGDVPDGFQVTVYGTNGTLYFTTDGTDPRASGGAVGPGAQTFQLPFTITAPTVVQARIRNGTNWSGLTTATFHPPQDLSGLVVTEIMYNPPAFGGLSGDEVEFVELKNIGGAALRLGSFTFTSGLEFTFPVGARLDPGQFFVLARNPAAFQAKYPGVAVQGVFAGRLDNGGETLRLSSPFGGTVLSITYNDRAPWPLAPDGRGFSLVPRNPLAAPNSDHGEQWRASSAAGGSPGADDPEPDVLPVLINEIMTHSEPPEVDWIELFNPNPVAIDLGGWFLSDDGAAPAKYRIPPGTAIAANGYRVFTETDFNAAPSSVYAFSLDSAGDAVYLTSADASTNFTGYSHGFAFGAAANGETFGRYVNSVGEEQFPAQLGPTRGGANAGPRVGPVIIQEISYHPEPGGDEFIELRNITGGDVELFDPAHPTNTWRVNGLSFTFPTNQVLAAQQRMLVVGTDPAVFRARHAVPAAVVVLGPFAGELQDSGERLELQRPDLPGTNGLPYVTVDGVRYNDHAPWPAAADGSGPSLQRPDPFAYGDDPMNWIAAVPTPGLDFAPGDTAPVVITQPLPQAVLASQTAQFAITAAGAPPLHYQWLFEGTPLSGATDRILLLTNVQPAQAGNYSAVVFNQAGSAASVTVRLTVNRQPTILAQPTNQLVRQGAAATFSVNAVGNGPLRFQWRLNGTNLLGATNAALIITNTQPVHAGIYTVSVSDNVGPILSSPASLILLVNPAIVQSPLSQYVLPGASVTLSVVVTNTANLPIAYLWRTNGRFWLTNLLYQHVAFVTITNARPPFTNYAVAVTNVALPNGLLSGPAVLGFVTDFDGDGLPDDWEAFYGFGTNSPANALLDADGDGMSNRDEYIAGTDPTDPSSYLRIESLSPGAPATLTVGVVANKTYSIEFNDGPGNSAWSRLTDLPARAVNHAETVVDPNYVTNRFYRVVTPRRP